MSEGKIVIELPVKSLDSARPNPALLEQILEHQDEFFVTIEDDPEFKGIGTAHIDPVAAFPTGAEVFVLSLAVTFVASFAKGLAEGAGKELGKETGAALGKRLAQWIKSKFPDVEVKVPDVKPGE